MSLLPRRIPGHRHAARGFSAVEALMSIVIVGIMLVAVMDTVGAAKMTCRRMGDGSRGTLLAQDLMSEILQQAYEDPDNGPGSFGLGSDEVGDGSRSLWEDVDDYHGWSASPPQQKDGTELKDLDGWGRRVAVQWVSPKDFALPSPSDTGVKQITVTVTHDGAVVVSLAAIRTNAWPELGEQGSGGGTPGNNPPTAVASASPSEGWAPLNVTFRGDGSSDPDAGDTLTYSWDFGDGDTGSGIVTTHTFNGGTYTVTLTVSDGHGGTDTDTVTIKAG